MKGGKRCAFGGCKGSGGGCDSACETVLSGHRALGRAGLGMESPPPPPPPARRGVAAG